MSEELSRWAYFSYLSGNQDDGAHKHMVYFSARKINILDIFLLFFTMINAHKIEMVMSNLVPACGEVISAGSQCWVCPSTW